MSLPPATDSDAPYGRGARWHHAHLWFLKLAYIAAISDMALAFWLSFVSDVDNTGNSGIGGGLEVLLLRIPQFAITPTPGAASEAIVGARVYLVIAVVSLVAAVVAGVTWLRSDRLRKPIKPPPTGVHAKPPRRRVR